MPHNSTADALAAATHILSAEPERTPADPTSGPGPSLPLVEPSDLLPADQLKALGLPSFAPASTPLDRMLDLVVAANGYRPSSDWAGDQLDRARSAWLLISPTGAIVGMGLTHHQAMKAAGLGVELPTGFRVARLTVDGDLAAFDAVLDTVHQAWTNREDLSPELWEQWARVNTLLRDHYEAAGRVADDEAELRATERERLSRSLAATPVADPAAEPFEFQSPEGPFQSPEGQPGLTSAGAVRA